MSEENQNIENFLRKGLENKEFQYREEDWKKLEDRLGALPPGPSPGMTTGKWMAISGALVVVSFVAGWFLNSQLQSEEMISQEVVNTSETNLPAEVPARDLAGETDQLASGSKTMEGARIANGVPVESADGPGRGVAAGSGLAEKTPVDGTEEDINPILDTEKEVARSNMASAAPAQYQAGAFARLHGKAAQFAGNELPPITLEFEEISYRPDFITNDVSSGEVKGNVLYKLAVGAAVSPDFSSTRPAPRLNEIGKSYGVFVEFQPLSKWRISTGVFKADKVYSAGRGDYSPPLYYGWPDGVEPTSTDAACDVLDIPLTAGYRLIDGRKTSFWLSGGISSYWMLSESYYYHYDDYNGYRLEGWWGENENKHPFSVVSFSFSVETFLTQTVSLKVEPFFKAPLAGVGYGKVNLYTSGAFFSIRYHFLKSKQF